jgi:hypothetical protein
LLCALDYPLSVISAICKWISTVVDDLWSEQPLYSEGVSKATATVAARIFDTDWSMDGDEVI